MTRRLAMNSEGQMTYCTASEENIGRGRCNHIAHQKPGETPQEFCERATAALNSRKPSGTARNELKGFNGRPVDYTISVKKGVLSDEEISNLKSKEVAVYSFPNGGYDLEFPPSYDESAFSEEVCKMSTKGSWKSSQIDDNPTIIYSTDKFEICPFALSGLQYDRVSPDRESVVKALEERKATENYWWCDKKVPDASKRGPQWDALVDEAISAAKSGKFDSSTIEETDRKIDDFMQRRCEEIYSSYDSDVSIDQTHFKK